MNFIQTKTWLLVKAPIRINYQAVVRTVAGVIKLRRVHATTSVIKMKPSVSYNLAPANYVQLIYPLLHAKRLICVFHR